MDTMDNGHNSRRLSKEGESVKLFKGLKNIEGPSLGDGEDEALRTSSHSLKLLV
jgi:hypothetical protein